MFERVKYLTIKINSLPWWERIMIWYTIFLTICFPIVGLVEYCEMSQYNQKVAIDEIKSAMIFIPVSIGVNLFIYIYIKIALLLIKEHFLFFLLYIILFWWLSLFVIGFLYLQISSIFLMFTKL